MSERTEQPTPQRIKEAREEGRVVRSMELNAAMSLLMSVWLLTGPGASLLDALKFFTTDSINNIYTFGSDPMAFREVFQTYIVRLIPSFGLILFGLLIIGVVTTVGQTGLLWAPKNIKFDFKRVNPLSGLKRLFSMNGLSELIKALAKIFVISYIAYAYLSGKMGEMLAIVQTDLPSGLIVFSEAAKTLATRIATAYFIIAIADYAYKRYEHNKSLMMTKEEIKEEFKQREGNPQVKAHIRGKQRSMAMARMMAAVPDASVIITNPTHLACAIKYDQDDEEMKAPLVLAKGAHHTAERIIQLAEENDIPIYQNIPLARGIYKNVEIDQEIPGDLYFAMAEVLAYVFSLPKKRKTKEVSW